jgi:hypothetical protein
MVLHPSSADGDTLAAADAPNDSIWLSTDSGQT